MSKTWKNVLIYIGIVLIFGLLAYGYTPEVLSGKIVNQSDISSWKGMANEAVSYNAEHPDDKTAWTDAMFGGMPTTAFIDDFDGDWTKPMYKFLLLGKRPASYLFIALLGAFLLMLSLGIDRILAVGGAIAVAFCSYNMQIIQVGHNTKMQAIAFFPWVLAAVIYTYRKVLEDNDSKWKKWLPAAILGACLFGLALSFQIKANHVQITYYLAIVIFIYAIGLFISLCIKAEDRKKLSRFFAVSACLLFFGLIGIGTNANKLIPTYEYTPYTMRGGSELTSDKAGHNDKGLDLEYATAWSYGINEMPNLMIPNFNGGSSACAVKPEKSETYKLLKRAGQPNLKETMKYLPMYWGPQPFTAGPMYLGAICVFLFILGLILCKGKDRWWILAATVTAVFLAWGNHFIWWTKLWFEYAPMYSKFRTVSMALTVLQFTVPMLAFLVLDRILKAEYHRRDFLRAGGIAWLLSAGFCLICALVPHIAGDFSAASDAGQHEMIVDAFKADRAMLLKADAWRSFFLISLSLAILIWYSHALNRNPKFKTGGAHRQKLTLTVAAVISLLVLFDLWGVDKRYLNNGHFITPKDFGAQYKPRYADKFILEDSDLSYRVLDISGNTFNNAIPSYHHKTIGGYSPVKMQRYQDLIDRYLSSEIRSIYGALQGVETVSEAEAQLPALKITSLLNGKYIIIDGDMPPLENYASMGNAFFVNHAVEAATPDEEIALLGTTDLSQIAVVGNDFAAEREKTNAAYAINYGLTKFTDESGDVCGEMINDIAYINDIELSHYSPKELRYNYYVGAPEGQTAVFTEIYYPKGWKAWIEPAGQYGEVKHGKYQPTAGAVELPLFRADWILRAAHLPQGEGTVVMRFEPESYEISAHISTACSITLLLLVLLGAAWTALQATRFCKRP
ncbi:MAG: hypothetical protein ACI3ZQ_00395 [Candidatus Cryptobacteroides sp.]